MRISLAVFLFILCFALPVYTLEKNHLFREAFDSLENWRPLSFPKIKSHTTYTVESTGKESYLKAESKSSASGLVYKKTFSIYEYPKAKWRWRVDLFSLKGDPSKKSGDDYPIRVYFMFRYDPEKASFFEKMQYGLAKKIYGEYPPHSTLNYVWSYTDKIPDVLVSPFTDKARIVVLRKGERYRGQWIVEEVDVLADYRKAFGKNPPSTAGVAIMSDSDNTRGEAASSVDFLEVYRDAP
ncbi:MAG: DUF3047 domain-containing protein [Nitrospirota bacterium]